MFTIDEKNNHTLTCNITWWQIFSPAQLNYNKNEWTSSKNLILSSARLIFISHIYGESVDLKYATMVQFLLTVK